MQPGSFGMSCGGVNTPESSEHSSAIAGSPLSSASSAPISRSLLLTTLPEHRKPAQSTIRSQISQTLVPVEFELFKHYLEHTSKDLTVDDDDQYTLQIGIPNLACQSKPLMRSVLAIAAVCKCCDIINQQSVSPDDRRRVLELLSVANDYHAQSLREIQAALPDTTNSGYDHVLANAAMMGMYGSGSHSVRIWLAKTATSSDQPLGDAMPKYSQWISLFRAVHVAYFGLLDDPPRPDDNSPTNLVSRSSPQVQYGYRVSSRVEQPRTPPDHVLHPILAATVGSALKRLREKTQEIVGHAESNQDAMNHQGWHIQTPDTDPDLQACLTALAILSSIVSEAFSPDGSTSGTNSYGSIAFDVDIDPVGRLSGVSPWLRKYTASITSMIPSRLPRRTIMAFIHKVPTNYLNLVEEINCHVPAGPAPGGGETARDSLSSTTPEPSLTHQLAVEIFAHWLVLVILLDNVWWIGGIGAWELGRIVSFRRAVNWPTSLWNKDEDWWPESMFEVSRQYNKHRTVG